MIKSKILAIFLSAIAVLSNGQTIPFQIAIEPINIDGLGGLQSFAWGQHDGKWLIIGGRLDGLHRMQPFAAFDIAGHNNQLMVVDPLAKQKWSAPLSSLPIGIKEQLSSTNMEFYQQGDFLYLIGGYGYSNTVGDHITHSKLTAVKVSDVINAIVEGKPFATNFRQITDPLFAVTGGYLNRIDSTFYLTGGQKFMGRYNPMGPNHGPGFFQEYTNANRRFIILDNGIDIYINHLSAMIDTNAFHRRDYNVVPQILPTGKEGITAFSGVFQEKADLPFLNSVNIDASGYSVNSDFSQYYNHYHCAHIPLYSTANNEMHNLFFGGIAQYYESSGILVQDNNVPFVKTIARVTRDANGTMAEYKLPIEMPSLLGAGSEFIPVESLPKFNNEVFKLDDFVQDTTMVGYIYGGISSTAANIFFSNNGNQSSASSQIFKVYIIKNSTVGIHELNTQSTGTLQMQLFPNPSNGSFTVKFNLEKTGDVKLIIHDSAGSQIENLVLRDLQTGENTYSKKLNSMIKGAVYFITIESNEEKATQKIVIKS